MAAPLATLTGMNALENLMDSEAGIVEVVLGTECLTIAPLATFIGINTLEMDSEAGIVEVVLGTEFQTMTDEQAIIKLGLKNWCRQFARKVGPSDVQFGSLFNPLYSPFRL